MPPQVHENAPWIDEVWQLVAVNQDRAHTPGMAWYIHQAGNYQRDEGLDDMPFYSPNLATNCQDNMCSFVSWGQQAHVPTNWTSNAIYMTRYTDCGHGVMEVEYMIHNFGDSLEFSYNNVPWGGVRTSVLRDALVAPGSGEDAEQIYPIPGWGASNMYLQNIKNLGGYTIFTQAVRTAVEPFEMPCFDASTGDSVACTWCSSVGVRIIHVLLHF